MGGGTGGYSKNKPAVQKKKEVAKAVEKLKKNQVPTTKYKI